MMEEIGPGLVEGRRWQIPRPSLSGSSGGSSSASATYATVPPHQPSSNNSTHSASSGSLLLSAANLAKVQNHRTGSTYDYTESKSPKNVYQSNLTSYVDSNRIDQTKKNLNRMDEIVPSSNQTDSASTIHEQEVDQHLDPFWKNVATAKNQRQDDEMSTASSTHFTVVNGFTRHSKNIGKQMWCCKSSHQITVLVISMTVLFMAGILAAICYVEMRQRRDSNNRFS